jgi:ABC-type Co2+ transport system permease subunit
MEAVFQFSPDWYYIFFGFLIPWIALLLWRKSYKSRRELKEQFCLAGVLVFVALAMEVFAVGRGLWHYYPDDWPVILWPTYFVAIMLGYQVGRAIEDAFRNKKM